jgi:outer membrane protein OmpA-like peptidoglycan-associated protein
MKIIYKLLITALVVTIVTASPAIAQDNDNQEPNRLSIGLFGGVTHGHMNIGTEYDPTFGLNVRYAFSPVVAVQTNLSLGTFNSTDEDGFQDEGNYYDRHFENSYFTTSVTSQVNLLRVFGSTSETVNVFANVGIGLIFNDVETEMGNAHLNHSEEYIGEDHSEPAMFATFGTGVRVNLGHRIDLFAQYDYNISNSDIIDGHRTRPERTIDLHRRTPDNWSSITAGLQIKFGSSDRDADWHTYIPGVDPNAFQRLEDRVSDLDERVHDNTARIDENERHIRALEERMDEFERRLDDLERLVAEMDRVELTVDSDVLFAFDSSTIRDEARPTLARVVRALANNPEKNITVAGHTCNIGTEEYNQGLSERRAESVKRFLVESGISENRVSTEAYGLTRPLVPNDTDAARQLNRRVEMVIE